MNHHPLFRNRDRISTVQIGQYSVSCHADGFDVRYPTTDSDKPNGYPEIALTGCDAATTLDYLTARLAAQEVPLSRLDIAARMTESFATWLRNTAQH